MPISDVATPDQNLDLSIQTKNSCLYRLKKCLYSMIHDLHLDNDKISHNLSTLKYFPFLLHVFSWIKVLVWLRAEPCSLLFEIYLLKCHNLSLICRLKVIVDFCCLKWTFIMLALSLWCTVGTANKSTLTSCCHATGSQIIEIFPARQGMPLCGNYPLGLDFDASHSNHFSFWYLRCHS